MNIYLALTIAICASAGLIGISGIFFYRYENKRLQQTIVEYEKHQTKLGTALLELENKMVRANESHRETIEQVEHDGYVYPACGMYTFTQGNQSCQGDSKSH